MKQVGWLIAISTSVRLFLASQLELGNDEVYYWTYASYPALSHFDHPPMVGLMAQLFSFDLFFIDDFFLRLGPIVLAAINTWVIFLIGRKVKNELAGLYAAFLYTSSIYLSILSGFSFIPDAPQIFFWLLSLYWLLDILPAVEIKSEHRRKMILVGITAGMAMLSKYHSVFIWVGISLYVLFRNRNWLRDYSLYLSGVISLLVFSPVMIWNIQNEFISFTFHGNRISPAFEIRPDFFLAEIVGQITYNNPLNIFMIVTALIALFKGIEFIQKEYKWILLLNAIPLWLVFTGFSLFRRTLPHWSGPAFLPLIIITAVYWATRIGALNRSKGKMMRPARMLLPLYFLAFLLTAALYVINYSPFQLGERSAMKNFGQNDYTQDMYGVNQLGDAFKKIAEREETVGSMAKGSAMISNNWFPGSHLDYYVAQPARRDLFMIGPLDDIHKYAWINSQRGGLTKGKDYYHIAVSNYYSDPSEVFGKYFESIEPMDTVPIRRGGEVMRYAFVFRLRNYNGSFINPIH